eukprot:COSAG01_NODE_489_length_16370_cov_7.973818_16_plen_48_part_00
MDVNATAMPTMRNFIAAAGQGASRLAAGYKTSRTPVEAASSQWTHGA